MEKIMGGYFMIARQIFKSQIWQDKPASWKIIWVYIIGNVNHQDNTVCKRGEGFFMFTKEIKNIGADITIDTVKKCLSFLRKNAMISTRRSTRGVYINVLKFDKYQNPNNYTSTDTSTKEALRKHQESTPINNKGIKKEGNNDNILQPEVAEELTYVEEYPVKNKTLNKQIFALMKKFQGYNPGIKINHKTHRKACEDLINIKGYELALRTVEYALAVQGREYSPTITTPTQLINKLGDLKAYGERQKAKTPTIVKI